MKTEFAPSLPLLLFEELPEATRIAIFDEAADLAYQTFDQPSDGHIECVFMRLLINHVRGEGTAGAITLH